MVQSKLISKSSTAVHSLMPFMVKKQDIKLTET